MLRLVLPPSPRLELLRVAGVEAALEEEHGDGEGGGGGFVGQGVPRFDAEGAAQQDRGDDEAGVAQDEAEVVEVAEGDDQKEDVDEDEGGEELVVEEVVEVGGGRVREAEELEDPG